MDKDDVRTKGRFLSALLLVFCCWHAAFLIYSVLPGRPGADDHGNAALDLYRLAFSGRQRWNLFATIPVHHSFDARLEGEDGTGKKIVTGSILPGFKPYPHPEDVRYYGLFNQMLSRPNIAPYREAYLRKAMQLMQDQRDTWAGENWALVIDTEYTRTLFHSRRDGQMWLPMTKTFPLPGPDSP